MNAVDLSLITVAKQSGYRLINSKYPPIHLFDDVASADDFEILYELQARTNPRLQNELGNLNLVAPEDRPFGIPGCSYALAPFTHVNPDGSRFSDGQRGMLYIADTMDTAIQEVAYHQQRYWQNVEGLAYDRLVLRSLYCEFDAAPTADACSLPVSHPIYDGDSYVAARALGEQLRQQGVIAVQYHSVRNHGSICWGLFTPRMVTSIKQAAHFEMIWDGKAITGTYQITAQ